MRTKIVVTLIGLSLLFLGLLYHSDSATVTQAEKVAAFTRNYCAEHEAYPEIAVMQAQFPELFLQGEWFYWPSDTLTQATYQYPMTLPLSSAPGSAKLSEFFPIIYANAHRNPCGDLSTN